MSPVAPARPSPARVTYAWTRFWAPLGSVAINLDGFLTDPEDELGARLNPNARSWSALAEQPCLVLLGEPGMGKSTEVERAACARVEAGRAKHVDLSLYPNEERLLRDVFDDGAVARWIGDGAPFELFFDALDESLFLGSALVKNLIARLRGLPLERTRVRIACRTADWPSALEVALRALYPESACSVWELLPLRRKDAIEAARASGVPEPESFVREIVRRDLEPLAIKPLTLEMLIRTSKDGPLPDSRRDLFEKATLLLAREPNELYPRAGQNLSPAQRLAVAERVAAAMLLCGKTVIARDALDAEPAELVLEQAAGGTERVGEATVEVDVAALSEAVRTGLFSGAGPTRLGWYHHALAEFLAARWIVGASLAPSQVDSLLFHPEDQRHVIPQLHAVAGWVAVYDSRLLAKLAATDPRLLLSGDASLDEAARAQVVEELLRRIDAVEAHDFDSRLRARYAALKHPGLASQIRPFIRDRSKNGMVRRVAIDIAEECGLVELEGELVDLALDSADAYGTRQQAVAALGKIGSASARRRLRRFVTEATLEDADDELRGYALHALWPEHLTREELFAALRAPRAPLYYGAYASFVTSLVGRLRDDDMADALDWAASLLGPVAPPSDERIIDEIVSRVQPLLGDSRVSSAYVRLAAASIQQHHSKRPPGWDALRTAEDPTVRRAHVLDVLALVGKDWIPSDGLLGPDDFGWILGQLDTVTDALRRKLIVDVIVRAMQFGVGVDDLDAVLTAALRHDDLANGIAGFTRAIDIDSEAAASLREQQRKFAEMMKRRERPLLDPAPVERVRQALEKVEAGDVDAFWHLGRELTLQPDSTHYGEDWKTRITMFSGWNAANDETRARIVSAAKRYVVEGDPKPSEWFCKGRIYYPAIGGCRALRLLLDVEPAALDALPPEIWAKWAPSVVTSRTLGNDREPAELDLLKRAYRSAPGAVLDVFAATMRDDDRRHKMLFGLGWVEQIWDAGAARKLTSMITVDTRLHPESTAQILALLLRLAAPGAVALANRLVSRARIAARVTASRIHARRAPRDRGAWRSVQRRGKIARERLERLLTVFLKEATAAAWPTMRQLLRADRAFCRGLFLEFASRTDHEGRAVSKSLSEDAVVEWYLWLWREFPPGEDPVFHGAHAVGKRESVGHLRNNIFNELVKRKSFAARDAIRHLARATGDRSLLVHAIDVEALALAEAWAPPTPLSLIRMLRDKEARLVGGGAHLLQVVLESLRRLQLRLQGEIAEVNFLWDGGGTGSLRPKDEESLSTYVAAHLDRDLRERGVIINREVQIRRRRGARPGEDTDIHVDAVTVPPQRVERLRVIIESKGNWNKHLETDLEDQLVNRYLAENEAHHGIYLVGWYGSANWDPSDTRKAAAERRDRAVLVQILAEKAKKLSQAGIAIEVCILDTRM